MAAKKKAPSFRGLVAASPTSSRVKQRTRHFDTTHERVLRSLLWGRGLRYRKNVKTLPGKPDLVFAVAKVVVFCDGDFWHGRNWTKLSQKLATGTNASYWTQKIIANRQRDERITQELKERGWTVLRYWETDIQRSGMVIADEIQNACIKNLGAHSTHFLP